MLLLLVRAAARPAAVWLLARQVSASHGQLMLHLGLCFSKQQLQLSRDATAVAGRGGLGRQAAAAAAAL
jgi:hypothetical protein